ncbi:MAG: hypothetical protein HKN92_12140 [Chitinophagales bacterium]|nr:hypothetical protein [Chitinophagales bacterium]
MKNSLILILLCVGFVIGLSSCGAKYEPMSEEKIEAQADSIFTADKGEYMKKIVAKCDSAKDAKIQARINELSNQ